MGYAVYDDGFNRYRFAGYGVPAVCDHPTCVRKIDRGLAYACGGDGDVDRSEFCGLYFCENHLFYTELTEPFEDEYYEYGFEDGIVSSYLCARCSNGEEPFSPGPEVPEWIKHVLTDESWAQWREENPEGVEKYQSDLGKWIYASKTGEDDE